MSTITGDSCVELINKLDVEILISGRQCDGVSWNKKRSFPPLYSKLYYIIDGDAYIDVDGKHYLLEPGRVYLIPTGLIYDNGCESFIDFVWFNIRLCDQSGRDYLAACAGVPSIEMPIAEMEKISEYYLAESSIGHIAVKAEILSTVSRLLTVAGSPDLAIHQYLPSVSRALEYINEHLSLRLTVDEICNNVYAARSTLNKRFTAEVGIPIGSYIDSEIMTRSAQLLANTDIPISSISERYGFCDQFYFSRRFKEKLGEPPQQYRKSRGG